MEIYLYDGQVTATKYSTVKGRGHVTAHLLTGSFLTAELTSASPYGLVLHRRTFLWAQFSLLSYLKLQMYNNKWQADRNATYPCASYPRIYFRGRLTETRLTRAPLIPESISVAGWPAN